MINTTERINIKDLVIPKEAEHSWPFDPLAEFTEEDWRLIQRGVDYNYQHSFNETIAKFLRNLRLLAPDGFNALNIREPNLEFLEEKIAIEPNVVSYLHDSYEEAIITLCRFSYVFPEKTRDILPDWDKVNSALRVTTSLNPDRYKSVFDLLTSYPEKLNKFNPDDAMLEGIKQDVEFGLRQIKDPSDSFRYSSIAATAAEARLLFPDRYLELPMGDSYERFRELFDEMLEEAKYDESKVPSLINFALSLRILAADQVLVDNQGLHLVMPSHPKIDSSLPQVRRF